MRYIDFRNLALSAALVMALAACALQPSASYERSVSEDDRWGVGANYPKYSSIENCQKDSIVETSLLSADMPPSRLGLRLVSGATEADALRVAKCLNDALTSGTIWISSPKP